MNSRFVVLLGAVGAGALLWACTENPTESLTGGRDRLQLQYAYREVILADSLRTFAIETDAGGSPLPPTATVASCNPSIVTVQPVSDQPLLRTGFYVKGISFGSACVYVSAGGLSDTMRVATFPSSIVVRTGPDTVVSGVAASYTHEYRDARNAALTGITAPTWTVNDTLRAVVDAATAVLTPRDSGAVNLTVRGIGTLPTGITGLKGVFVIPAPFTATIVPNPADPGQVVTFHRAAAGPTFDSDSRIAFGASVQTFVSGSLTADSVKVAIPDLAVPGALSVAMTRLGVGQITQSGTGVFTVNTPGAWAGTFAPAAGVPTDIVVVRRGGGDPVFDADTRVYFGGIRTFIAGSNADTLAAVVPALVSTGATELRMTRLGADNRARGLTFTATDSLADRYDDVNNDPTTAPAITANGDYFITLYGGCSEGVGGAGTDCDDFFRVANPSPTDTLFARVDLDWLTGADIDVLWCRNAGCTSVTAGGGATTANPEVSNVKVPPGATWYLWLNLWEPEGSPAQVARVRFSGLP